MANEKRLIDANALLESKWWDSLKDDFDKARAKIIVQSCPTVDAVEVVHGWWLKTQEPLGWRDVDCVECSACHESWVIDEDYEFDDFGGWNYCPHCGAKMMDGGNEYV